MKPPGLRTIRETIKYLVVIGDIFMTLHCILLICGVRACVVDFLFGQSLSTFLVLYMSSYLLGFCDRFRHVIIHSFTVQCCILYQMRLGFGVMLDSIRVIMMAVGAAVISNLFIDDEHGHQEAHC